MVKFIHWKDKAKTEKKHAGNTPILKPVIIPAKTGKKTSGKKTRKRALGIGMLPYKTKVIRVPEQYIPRIEKLVSNWLASDYPR